MSECLDCQGSLPSVDVYICDECRKRGSHGGDRTCAECGARRPIDEYRFRSNRTSARCREYICQACAPDQDRATTMRRHADLSRTGMRLDMCRLCTARIDGYGVCHVCRAALDQIGGTEEALRVATRYVRFKARWGGVR